MNASSPLDPRLKTLTLGVTTTAAAATSLALPEKAEAFIPFAHGFHVNSTILTAPGTTYLNLHLDLTNTAAPIVIGAGTSYGWNLQFVNFGPSTQFLSGAGFGSITYEFLPGYYTATQTFNLAAITSGLWSTSFYQDTNSFTVGQTYYLGLRASGTAVGTVHGWMHVQSGSLTHLQSAFNLDPNGPITIGQIPEPSAALLLAVGSTGLLAARRRRKKAA
ncbi:MAG: PEP-CTERM sorting domain-containing protein [Verrucomicrobiota bacterium]